MHQPLYKDPETEIYELPWTLLHALKDYRDFPLYLDDFKIKCNFNLTPVLIDQIQEYSEKKEKTKCMLLDCTLKQPDELTLHEKSFLAELIKILPEKLLSVIPHLKSEVINNSAEKFPTLDVQILYLLAWAGNKAKNAEAIKTLLQKGKNYTQADKYSLIQEIFNIIKEVIPTYKRLKDEGRISISTSAYYHPILPLLFNIESAKEAVPQIQLPTIKTDFSTDGKIQIDKAIKKFEDVFSQKLRFLWPPEGGVSEKVCSELNERKIKAIATDEEILFNSYAKEKSLIYKRWNFNGITILFRDRELSDLIGFVYQNWDAEHATADFLSKLKKIHDSVEWNPLVSVILDGENCWEYYPQNGDDFIKKLYSKIEKEKWIETITLDEIENIDVPEEKLPKIVAGSWVGGNFLKWIGSPEKNKYWEMLADAKLKKPDSKNYENLLVSQGSDWFWWQGEGNVPFVQKFDKLFRNNLKKFSENYL